MDDEVLRAIIDGGAGVLVRREGKQPTLVDFDRVLGRVRALETLLEGLDAEVLEERLRYTSQVIVAPPE